MGTGLTADKARNRLKLGMGCLYMFAGTRIYMGIETIGGVCDVRPMSKVRAISANMTCSRAVSSTTT